MSKSNASTFDLTYDIKAVGAVLPPVPKTGGPGRPSNPKIDELARVVHENPGTWFSFAQVPHVTVGDKRRAMRVASNLRTSMARRNLKFSQRLSDDRNTVVFYARTENGSA